MLLCRRVSARACYKYYGLLLHRNNDGKRTLLEVINVFESHIPRKELFYYYYYLFPTILRFFLINHVDWNRSAARLYNLRAFARGIARCDAGLSTVIRIN